MELERTQRLVVRLRRAFLEVDYRLDPAPSSESFDYFAKWFNTAAHNGSQNRIDRLSCFLAGTICGMTDEMLDELLSVKGMRRGPSLRELIEQSYLVLNAARREDQSWEQRLTLAEKLIPAAIREPVPVR